jgi:hypothetical protein
MIDEPILDRSRPPLNGDVAGLVVRATDTRDAWWSPAGFNRGTRLHGLFHAFYAPVYISYTRLITIFPLFCIRCQISSLSPLPLRHLETSRAHA